MSSFIRFLYSLLIAAAAVTFTGISIATFYSGPKEPAYPAPAPIANTSSASSSSSGTNTYQAAYDRYLGMEKAYERNVSLIIISVAVVIITVGLWMQNRSEIIGDGLTLGGIGSSVYGLIAASAADNRIMRFVAVVVFFVGTIFIAYYKFSIKLSETGVGRTKK